MFPPPRPTRIPESRYPCALTSHFPHIDAARFWLIVVFLTSFGRDEFLFFNFSSPHLPVRRGGLQVRTERPSRFGPGVMLLPPPARRRFRLSSRAHLLQSSLSMVLYTCGCIPSVRPSVRPSVVSSYGSATGGVRPESKPSPNNIYR